jgi:hypothetical protein
LSDNPLSSAFVAPSLMEVVSIAKLAPCFDKVISTELRLGPVPPLPFHATDGVGGLAGCGFVQQSHIAHERGPEVAGGAWPDRV